MSEDIQSSLKQAMRVYPQGVTVVTVQGPDGPRGLTVSSFTSVSLAPPLVLFCVAKNSSQHDFFSKADRYAINFLADDQKTISDRFAGRTKAKDRFEGVKHTRGVTGSPIISGVRAAIECRSWRAYDAGDHSIVVGEVVAASAFLPKRPLLYYSQLYTTTERGESPAPPSDIVW
ncbi:MAG: flavin reductase family protein [Nitrososphaerota archaeon]|nr:flavin reductase family protein [Nitrososphaerota archaeon]MDG6957924.1 flavin reductase family protein [Nitrososphaerota archaeon]MDG6959284.1 flavin reductase family protein [Nitrososphaerota archaeon]MDG6969133.1 flavin reductase family protein [Nitrososphaerota archaeon]MDG6971987.1 flavin reductase family protein [Nitrososphaerota archaeon]